MAAQSLIDQVLAFPLAERLDLAEALWQSLGDGFPDVGVEEIIDLAQRRVVEMTDGTVVGRTHDEVMRSARRAIGCD